jgi:N-methylhydantoinase A
MAPGVRELDVAGEAMIRVAFDIGGTFTDFVLDDTRTGHRHFGKVPTTPSDPANAVICGLEELLARTGVPPGNVTTLLHATTVATNAILERKGARTALVASAGFRDILIIGRQKRYETYDLYLDKPQPLARRRDIFEVQERVLYDGTVEKPLDEAGLARVVARIAEGDYESVAVCLMHAYANPQHERRVGAAIANRLPHVSISLSSDVSPKYREYERTSTVAANAYIKPLVGQYVRQLQSALRERKISAELFIMQSNGGLVPPEFAAEKPVHIIESGPAAGVLMCAEIGRQETYDHLLTFDMGGTTAKLGAIDGGEPAIVPVFEVDQIRYRKGSGLPLNIAAIELLEIGAGGGSIASTDLGLISVGPESAGAEPGPICYQRGGQRPTITDANVALGYIDPQQFNGGAMPLDAEAALAGIESNIAKPLGIDPIEAAWGIHTMANSNMERAMRIVSVERGRDPRKYVLVAFGGAGPLHAARLARAIGIPRIIVPYGAGVGSAIGLLEADSKIDQSVTRVLRLAAGVEPAIANIYADLENQLTKEVAKLGGGERAKWRRYAYMRYAGQGHEIRVDLPEGDFGPDYASKIADLFHAAYHRVYGYKDEAAAIDVVDWYLTATVPRTGSKQTSPDTFDGKAGSAHRGVRRAYFPERGGFTDCDVFDRYKLRPGEFVVGPAIIEERESTIVILPGDKASLSERGNLLIEVGE